MSHKGMPFDKLNDQLSIVSYLLCSLEKIRPRFLWRLTNNKKSESINIKHLRLEIMRANAPAYLLLPRLEAKHF